MTAALWLSGCLLLGMFFGMLIRLLPAVPKWVLLAGAGLAGYGWTDFVISYVGRI